MQNKSLRDEIAIAVLPILLRRIYDTCDQSDSELENVYVAASIASYECADEMIKVRKG